MYYLPFYVYFCAPNVPFVCHGRAIDVVFWRAADVGSWRGIDVMSWHYALTWHRCYTLALFYILLSDKKAIALFLRFAYCSALTCLNYGGVLSAFKNLLLASKKEKNCEYTV